MSTVWQNTAGAREFFPAAWLSLMAVAAVRPPALVVTLCRALSGEREMTPRDRPLCRATVGGPLSRPPNPHIGVCKSGALQKKLAPTAPRHPPAYAAETTTSLSPCSLSARQNVSVQVWSRDRGASREFFFCTTICIVCRSTYYYYYYYCRTIISPFFATVKNGRSANYFLCADHLHGWRPYRSLSLPFLQLPKNYQPNLIMHTFIVWRDLHLSHCSKQGVPFKMCGFLLLISTHECTVPE